MQAAGPIRATLLTLALCAASVSAQDLVLPKDSEAGFLRFMQTAQSGGLGHDVTNVNIYIAGPVARVELVRLQPPNPVVVLTTKSAQQAVSRYFDIAAGDNATAADVALVGRALDAAFDNDPFQLSSGFFDAVPGPPLPSLWDSWQDGGWGGVDRTLVRHIAALVGLPYVLAVIVTAAAGLAAAVVVLWTATPPAVRRAASSSHE